MASHALGPSRTLRPRAAAVAPVSPPGGAARSSTRLWRPAPIPRADPRLAAHAARLARPHQIAAWPTALERAVEAADRPQPLLSSAVPVRAREVLEARDELLGLVAQLRTTPEPPRAGAGAQPPAAAGRRQPAVQPRGGRHAARRGQRGAARLRSRPRDVPSRGVNDYARRGHHKVFLGMAAGVGKTYRALQELRAEYEAGRDAVIGYLEPHARADTEAQAEGLPRLARRRVTYKDVTLEELDAAGADRPAPRGRADRRAGAHQRSRRRARQALRGRPGRAGGRDRRVLHRQRPAPRVAQRPGGRGDRRARARDAARPGPLGGRRGRARRHHAAGADRAAARRQGLPLRARARPRSTASSASRTSRRCARSRCARSPRTSRQSACARS